MLAEKDHKQFKEMHDLGLATWTQEIRKKSKIDVKIFVLQSCDWLDKHIYDVNSAENWRGNIIAKLSHS